QNTEGQHRLAHSRYPKQTAATSQAHNSNSKAPKPPQSPSEESTAPAKPAETPHFPLQQTPRPSIHPPAQSPRRQPLPEPAQLPSKPLPLSFPKESRESRPPARRPLPAFRSPSAPEGSLASIAAPIRAKSAATAPTV